MPAIIAAVGRSPAAATIAVQQPRAAIVAAGAPIPAAPIQGAAVAVVSIAMPTVFFQISAASSFSAPHSFARAPRVTLLDPDGEEIWTDTKHLPGLVLLSFPAPFTGTLILS